MSSRLKSASVSTRSSRSGTRKRHSTSKWTCSLCFALAWKIRALDDCTRAPNVNISHIAQFHGFLQSLEGVARGDEFLSDVAGVFDVEQFSHDWRVGAFLVFFEPRPLG